MFMVTNIFHIGRNIQEQGIKQVIDVIVQRNHGIHFQTDGLDLMAYVLIMISFT